MVAPFPAVGCGSANPPIQFRAVPEDLRKPISPTSLVHLGKMDLQGSLPAIAQNWSNIVRVRKISTAIAF